ncbi:hypothetical protein NM208_g5983 [Fusarium decemcellulare]|uniref:Uncharacterized protein n=1 Tax=Fusarium decemcellulare TaxID=57161 RepID=A0ACC1SF08_9HYPO|nr:hypothetical protein NM208_g5983 [Fusarium decemcellulare]
MLAAGTTRVCVNSQHPGHSAAVNSCGAIDPVSPVTYSGASIFKKPSCCRRPSNDAFNNLASSSSPTTIDRGRTWLSAIQVNPSHTHGGIDTWRNYVNIAWLDQEWGGSGWIPSELRENFGSYRLKEPCGETVELLCMITTAAKARDINPADLWLPDGALRVAVERDTEEKTLRYVANKWHAKPKAHLSVKVARAALGSLAHETGTDCIRRHARRWNSRI